MSGEQSTAELVRQASEQASRLVRDEIALARAELAEKGRHAGAGAGLFGGSVLVALYGIGALVIAAIAGLAAALPAWLAALIVGVVLLLIAGLLALTGRRQVRQAVPPAPAAATEGMRADLAAVTTAFRARGNGHRHGPPDSHGPPERLHPPDSHPPDSHQPDNPQDHQEHA